MADDTSGGGPIDGAEVRRLEGLAADCWPPAETESLDGWRLGFMGGVTRRANSALPLGWTGARGLDAAIDAAEESYRARGLPPVFKITEAALPAGLPDALTARGYGVEGESDVLARRAEDFPEASDTYETHLFDAPTPDWTAVSLAGRTGEAAAALAALAGRLAPPRAFALVAVDGAPACAGFAARVGDWVSIAGIHTLDAARRQGAARMLMTALARWSAAAGAHMMVLQVERDNAAAAALYRGLGFDRLYGYHYRVGQT